MKIYCLSLLVIITIISCNSKFKTLSSYYSNNIKQHVRISKELMSFCKIWKCEVTLRQSFELGNIIFEYHVNSNPEFELIEFDSLFNRHDRKSNRTSNAIVDVRILKDFRESIYHSIRADSNEVFFGYEFTGKGDSELGVLVWNTDVKIDSGRIMKMLSANACISTGIIP